MEVTATHDQRSVRKSLPCGEREFFIDNLLVRIHFIIMMIRWTGLAPRAFEFPFPGSLISTFLEEPAVHSIPTQSQTKTNPVSARRPSKGNLVQIRNFKLPKVSELRNGSKPHANLRGNIDRDAPSATLVFKAHRLLCITQLYA